MDPYLALSVQKHILDQGVRNVMPRYLGDPDEAAAPGSPSRMRERGTNRPVSASARRTAGPGAAASATARVASAGGVSCGAGGVWVERKLWLETQEQARQKAALEKRVESLSSQLEFVDKLQAKCRDLEAGMRELSSRDNKMHANLSPAERSFVATVAEHDGAGRAAGGVEMQRVAARAREAEARLAGPPARATGFARSSARRGTSPRARPAPPLPRTAQAAPEAAAELQAAVTDLRREARARAPRDRAPLVAAREAEAGELRKAARATTALLQHVNQLEHDNARLVALLQSTAEYRQFARAIRFGRASYLLPAEAPSFADLHVLAHRDAIAGDRPVLGPAAEAAFWVPEAAVAAVEARHPARRPARPLGSDQARAVQEFRWRWAREAPSAALARMVAAVGAAFRSTFGAAADAACPE
eukprot:tig00021042_g17600.t1